MRTIAIALLAVSALFCQDAKIIIVERQDTRELKAAYADYKAAQAKWEKVKTEVAKKYTTETPAVCTHSKDLTCEKIMDGWEKVEFSVDFRALVPQRQYAGTISENYWPQVLTSSGTGITLTGNSNASDLTVSSDSIRSDLKTREGAGGQQ